MNFFISPGLISKIFRSSSNTSICYHNPICNAKLLVLFEPTFRAFVWYIRAWSNSFFPNSTWTPVCPTWYSTLSTSSPCSLPTYRTACVCIYMCYRKAGGDFYISEIQEDKIHRSMSGFFHGSEEKSIFYKGLQFFLSFLKSKRLVFVVFVTQETHSILTATHILHTN